MAGRRLRLQRYSVTNVNFQYLGAYRLRVVVDDPEDTGADPNVFLFLRRPIDPVTEVVLDEFQAIASPADMAEYPQGEPNSRTTYPMFRHSVVTLDLRNVSLADKVWTTMVREIAVLQRAIDTLEPLVLVEEVTVGEPADTGNSLSTSGSGSA